MNKAKRICKRITAVLLLLLILSSTFLFQSGVFAKDEKVVRVGWYDSTFNIEDDKSRRSGYAYEYQQKIASYVGWKYEYVEGSWPDLLEMLIEGKIDLMSDVSYTAERAEKMLYSTQPMGTEAYYLFTTPDNLSIDANDYSTFNGKSVGVIKGSVQVEMLKEWEKKNNVSMKIVELTVGEKESLSMLASGKIDLYLTPESMRNVSYVSPVCEIGSSDFYFTVNKQRKDLLMDLNVAMGKIIEENPYYNLQLYAKYLSFSKMHRYFNQEELDWIKSHGKIRVGYQDNYLAFCAQDPKTGELIGALKDYLDAATDCMDNATLEFETICYPTSEAAFEALKQGKVDCVFPTNLTDYYGEVEGFYITDALMTTEMSAIVQESQAKNFFNRERTTVAVNVGNTNYDMFLVNYFPDWRPLYFKDSIECLNAISQGKADCLIISNYRYNNLAATCRKLGLTAIAIGVEMDYCYAVNRGNTMLYSILNKVNGAIPSVTVNTSLSNYYRSEEVKIGFGNFLLENIILILAITVAVAFMILYLIRRRKLAELKAIEHERLITATQTDELTGLLVRSYFFQYAESFHKGNPDVSMDAIVLNINRFHSVNGINSYEFGDLVLRELGDEINNFLGENYGIATRTEADHFAIYCHHIENYHLLYQQLQGRMDALNSRTNIQLRMGIMPSRTDLDPHRMVDNAIIACNLAREVYGEQMLVYDDEMSEREVFEQKILADLRHALENNEFEVHYQPKFDIQQEPAKLVGAEALVRWQHPELGRLTPNQFIGLFERTGRINELDKYVLEKVTDQIVLWKEKYGTVVPISVNLSRVDILNPMLGTYLDMTLENKGISHGCLKLEITESAYIENEELFVKIIQSLREKGYVIEMDDFGTAYSSLNMLSSMPIDSLKMDREFVYTIETDEKRQKLVELILNIAKSLDVPVIAEGVETEEQIKLLKKMGCAIVQGFYYSPALSAEEFEKQYMSDEQ